jgi:uncharacterized protein DUF861
MPRNSTRRVATCPARVSQISTLGIEADGETRELGPGDLLVLPRGWKGEWRIWETTRKLYAIQSAD